MRVRPPRPLGAVARRRVAEPPTLVAVAHGTRDPAGPACIDRLLDAVRARVRDVGVTGCYVELAEPRLEDVLARLRRPAVVVPLLLSTGHHVRNDLPAAAGRAAAPVALAPPLGPSDLLTTALVDRVVEAGASSHDPVVLGAAGSSDPAAGRAVRRAARLLAGAWPGPVGCGFLSHVGPSVATAVGTAAGVPGGSVAVVPYLLAPGRFAAELAATAEAAGAARAANVLGAHPAVADLVVERYRERAARPRPARAG